jgi:hypothetical protein
LFHFFFLSPNPQEKLGGKSAWSNCNNCKHIVEWEKLCGSLRRWTGYDSFPAFVPIVRKGKYPSAYQQSSLPSRVCFLGLFAARLGLPHLVELGDRDGVGFGWPWGELVNVVPGLYG